MTTMTRELRNSEITASVMVAGCPIALRILCESSGTIEEKLKGGADGGSIAKRSPSLEVQSVRRRLLMAFEPKSFVDFVDVAKRIDGDHAEAICLYLSFLVKVTRKFSHLVIEYK